ncbi:MAG: response regulator [Inquilinus sp.]|nr:response regulator [Inquilinus sp.]
MDDLLGEFLTETSDSLSVLDIELVKLEQTPNDPELLGNIFRLVHTIKGTCGFLGLPRLESVAHAGENVLGKFRDGEVEVTAGAVTLILESLDTIKMILSGLEETEKEPEGDDADLIARLNAAAKGNIGGAAAPAPDPEPAAQADPEAAVEDDFDSIEVPVEEPAAEAPKPAGAEAPAVDDFQPEFAAPDSAPVIDLKIPGQANIEPVASGGAVALAGGQEVADASVHRESSIANQSIRVSVPLLENLMTMVSELVLTRNQLLQIMRSQKDSEFVTPLQRLNHVTSELQEGVMKTRMQPIGNAWAKLPRLIRDLSQDLDKKINLKMIGEDTELDRQVLELIKDPLTHMVRNSADHGIEQPHERLAAGKSEAGTVRLNAYHEGGHIHIEIADDGRGLPIEKISKRIVENGLATEAELAGLSDQQIQQFIFRAGFSTAEAVTNVSGRGVGMDVVRTNIEKIGGTVELKSTEGRGSTFLIKIPLTLAIVSALIVEAGGERFAIPQISVVELVKAGGTSEHVIDLINGTPVLRLRDRLMPLVSLPKLLNLQSSNEATDLLPKPVEGEAADAEAKSAKDKPKAAKGAETEVDAGAGDCFVVVAQVGAYAFGVIVDRVFDTEEIVVKPVAPILRDIEIFSGNTILGDGSVIMILDPNGIAAATGEVGLADSRETADAESRRSEDERVALLLFRSGAGAPKAVPLALVARLEDIDLEKIETSNGTMVIQYRGRLMPLIPFDGKFDLAAACQDAENQRRSVLVFADGDRSMGLIVDEIIDIVEQPISVELTGERSGVLGSAIIAGRATDVIDSGYYLTKANRDWFRTSSEPSTRTHQRRVLLVDDSPFFLNMITPILSVAGYSVTSVASADEAIALRDAGEDFDIIVSDIEMPGMDGFQFAEQVKGGDRWSNTPIVALSSRSSPLDLDRGRQAGFNDYVTKLDRDALLESLSQTLADVRGAA